MLENLAPNIRLFVLVCAAVMSFIMCPDAARVSPITNQEDNRVKHKVLRQLYTPNSLHHHFMTGPLSAETGFQSGSSSKTETKKHFGKTSSIINRQSNPLADGSSGYSRNNPDNRHSHAGITRLHSGILPENNIFTSNNQHERDDTEKLQSRAHHHTTAGNVYNSYPAIIRKSSRHKAASPFYQSSSRPQVAQESYKVPMIDFSNQADDRTTWQSSYSSPFSSQTRSASLPAQRWHYSSDKETNELPGSLVRSTSRAIQSRKYQSFAGQAAPHTPSISKSIDINVIKRIKSPISSITDFSQGWRSLGSTETPRLNNIQSYLFQDSQTSSSGYQSVNTRPGIPPSVSYKRRPSDAQVNGKFLSNIQQKSTTKDVKHPSEGVIPPYQTTDGSHTHRLLQSHRTTVATGTPTSVHPVPGIADIGNTFLPNPHANIQVNYATVNKESSSANATTSGSMQTQNPGRNQKNIYGFKGFQNLPWRSSKEPSAASPRGLNEGTNSLQYRYGRKFKTTKLYPSISRKYSFSQRGQFPTTPPPKLERQQTSTPGARGTIQTMRNPGPITSVSKETHPLVAKSDSGSNGNKKFRIFRRIYGLKGFSDPPLEGAKGSLSEPEKSTGVQEDLGGLKLRSSQVLKPISKGIQRFQFNEIDAIEPGRKHGSTLRESEPKKHFETSGGTESVDGFSPNKKEHKLFNFPGFQIVRNRFGGVLNKTTWKYKSGGTSSSFVGSSGPLQGPDPRTSNSTRPVPARATLLNRSTSSTVRGKRVKVKQVDAKGLQESKVATNNAGNVAIVRMPKPHARVKAFTFSDILGSASFSGVRATMQTLITPADEDSTGNTTAATKQEVEVLHWPAEDEIFSRHPEDESEDFSRVEENEQDIKSKDPEFKTSDLFSDNEGSGSGDFNMFDVFSTKSNRLSEDLLELDYLRISAGNVSFKSMNVSRSDQMRA